MSRARKQTGAGWATLAIAGGVAAMGTATLVLLTSRRDRPDFGAGARPRPTPDRSPVPREQDIEAAARMIASENPHGRARLHIEQIWTQLRAAARTGQSLFDRITAGSGYGPQGERAAGGKFRPVSTAQPATPHQRALAREVLEGKHPSFLPGATRFFEPAVEDAAFRIAETARSKQAAGLSLSAQERRLLKYRRDADDVRRNWSAEQAERLGTFEGVEFWGKRS